MKSDFFKTLLSRLNSLLVCTSLLVFVGFQSCQVQDELDEPNSNNLKNATIQDGNSIAFWGHETFTRSTGKPEVVKKKIGSADLIHFEPEFVLHLKNGDGTNYFVSSAIVKLNGKQIFGPSDFSKKVTSLSKGITGLTENSELEVELRSTPESYIDVWIEGKMKPGHALITPKGGEFSLLNGEVKFLIGEGSINSNVFISVENIYNKLPDDYKQGITCAYELFPNELIFNNLISATIKLPANLNNDLIPISFGPFSLETGYMEWNECSYDKNENCISFEISHFSLWAGANSNRRLKANRDYYYSIFGNPSTVLPKENINENIRKDILRFFNRMNFITSNCNMNFIYDASMSSNNISIYFLTPLQANIKFNVFESLNEPISQPIPLLWYGQNTTAKVYTHIITGERAIVFNDDNTWFSTKYYENNENGGRLAYSIEGTLIHEFSHCLGLDDEYKTDNNYISIMGNELTSVPISFLAYDINKIKGFYQLSTMEFGNAIDIENLTDLELIYSPEQTEQTISNALKIKVLDIDKKGVPGVTVVFYCNDKNLEFNDSQVTMTDFKGEASLASLKLPSLPGEYNIKARIWAEPDFKINPTPYLAALKEKSFKITVKETPNEGLIAYYPFNGNANDESGNGKNGIISGAVFSNDRNNKSSSSLFFDGSNDYVLVKPAILNSNTSFTACAWIKPETIDEVRAIIWERSENENDYCGNFSAGNWALEIYENKLCHDIASIDNSGTCKWDRVFYNSQISHGNWYFICSVYNKTDKTFKLYINGELSSSTLENSNLRTWAGAVTNIGRNTALVSNQYWHGNIDDIRIYNRPLTEQEIKSLAQE